MNKILRPDGSVYCLIEAARGEVITQELSPPGTVDKETLEYFQKMADNQNMDTN